MRDLAGNPDYKEKVRQLFGELIALQKDIGDTLDLKDVYHEGKRIDYPKPRIIPTTPGSLENSMKKK